MGGFRFSLFEFRLLRIAAAGIAIVAIPLLVFAPQAHAQGPGTGAGLAETLEAIERARVTTRILYVTAHPDDESSSILTYLARGLHADVALLSLTRGEGGQNALGPEQGPPLGVIRTEELLRATQQYGVRLYFTRAPDFGYSKTPEETLRIWGDAVLDDMVEVLRHFRPHIVINQWSGITTGHGHHQAAGLLVPRALEAVAKRDNEWPWAETIVFNLVLRGDPPAHAVELPTDEISPLWGKSYNELGLEGFVNHRTQGIVGFRNSRFFRGRRSLIPAQGPPSSIGDFTEPLGELGKRYPRFEEFIDGGTKDAHALLAKAGDAARALRWAEAIEELCEARIALNTTKWMLAVHFVNEVPASAVFDLQEAEEKVRRALDLAAGVRVNARAGRGEIVAGESFEVVVDVATREGVGVEVDKIELKLPLGWDVLTENLAASNSVRFTVSVPKNVTATAAPWWLAVPEPLLQARIELSNDSGNGWTTDTPVTAQRVTTTRVDELPLTLVPAVTLTPEPRQFVIARGQPPKALELVTRVRHHGSASAEVEVALHAPAGWQASTPVKVKFEGAGDQLVRFTVTPPRNPPAGSFRLEPVARLGGAEFRTSLEPLPTLPTRLWSEPAAVDVRVFDLNVPRGLRVGYVAAENDAIPSALRQLGIEVTLLDENALAFGDLARFDAIAIGIRAYELREDLLRSNRRLLDYCAAGGTLVVQYQRDSAWNNANPAPFPAKVGDPTLRVSVEDAPVRVLAPAHAVLNQPNRIGAADFDGWVQERGLYYWGEFDARYTPLLGMHDPGETETTGSLVVAQHGRGTYVYTGLSFFRQLPAGVPGAYRLFVNLLSQSKLRSQSPPR